MVFVRSYGIRINNDGGDGDDEDDDDDEEEEEERMHFCNWLLLAVHTSKKKTIHKIRNKFRQTRLTMGNK
jgi:hypothetical protein